MQKATLGSGCFWCVEAVFQTLKGVNKVLPGYSGGKISNPTYREVCSGLTGHAEVVQIEFDEKVISFIELLEVFFKTHDPTTLNKQGGDVGTQYRSSIFYHSEEQKETAEEVISKLNNSKAFPSKIVTEVVPFKGYCQMVVRPKVEKFKKVFENKLK